MEELIDWGIDELKNRTRIWRVGRISADLYEIIERGWDRSGGLSRILRKKS
jgi:hypothetical protein